MPVQLDGLNSVLSPILYGDIALSINTQYNTIHTLWAINSGELLITSDKLIS